MLALQLTEDEFGTRLHQWVSPARPIQSIEHLQGRAKELAVIKKALFAPGRHIFIFGDRGVGKSSLAAAAANLCQSSDAPYIDIGCTPDSSLIGIVANIAYQAMNTSRLTKTRLSKSVGFEYKFLKASASHEITLNDLHSEIKTLLDAVEVLREVAALHSEKPVVVLDEFDRIVSANERNLFADLVKQLGDKKVGVTFFFTGVAKTLDELLGAHSSAIRQFETIELPKLSWTARWDIAKRTAETFGLEIDEQVCIRIAAVSDGYPYYVHLITEKLMWRAFEDEKSLSTIDRELYHLALRDAIDSINAELRRPYEMAVSQRTDDYQQILWATADSEYLDRDLKQMYTSYTYLMKQRALVGHRAVEYDANIIRKLKSKSCGEILIPARFNRKGWLSYKDPVLRGYVRMQAEAHGLELIGEQIEAPKQTMHAPAGAGRGYKGPSIPKGVHLGRGREKDQNFDDEGANSG
jgi:uncharacterized protein